MTSPPARLIAFLLLLAVMFAGAYAVGGRLGPVQLSHQGPGSMHMPMGSGSSR